MLTWKTLSYEELTVDDLYDILSLRQAVFVVEQHCPYLDVDGKDQYSHHLLGRNDMGELVAYLRIVAPGRRFAEPSIGRVIVRFDQRGKRLGVVLMEEGVRLCTELYPGQSIHISAQHYLQRFYESLGFRCLGEGNPFDEDGIPHIEMILEVQMP